MKLFDYWTKDFAYDVVGVNVLCVWGLSSCTAYVHAWVAISGTNTNIITIMQSRSSSSSSWKTPETAVRPSCTWAEIVQIAWHCLLNCARVSWLTCVCIYFCKQIMLPTHVCDNILINVRRRRGLQLLPGLFKLQMSLPSFSYCNQSSTWSFNQSVGAWDCLLKSFACVSLTASCVVSIKCCPLHKDTNHYLQTAMTLLSISLPPLAGNHWTSAW